MKQFKPLWLIDKGKKIWKQNKFFESNVDKLVINLLFYLFGNIVNSLASINYSSHNIRKNGIEKASIWSLDLSDSARVMLYRTKYKDLDEIYCCKSPFFKVFRLVSRRVIVEI